MDDRNDVWQIDAECHVDQQRIQNAHCASGDFAATLDLLRPGDGLQQVVWRDRLVTELSCLRIAPHPPSPAEGETILEAYPRGADLIVHYAQLPVRTSRPAMRWSLMEAEPAVGVEVTLSMQTSLLDSDPTLSIQSRFGSGSVLQLPRDASDDAHCLETGQVIEKGAPSGFVFRPERADWSYVELVFPADFCGAHLRAAEGKDGTRAQKELVYQLFHEPLEKGVIRKARIQSLFLPRADDIQNASMALRKLVAAPTPLAT